MINVERIKKQVQKAIATMPTEINLKRLQKTDDGYGGEIEQEIDVATFSAFMEDKASGMQINVTTGDAGTLKRLRNISFIAVYDNSFTIKAGDYFTIKETKYKVRYPSNQYDIFWQCELEVVS